MVRKLIQHPVYTFVFITIVVLIGFPVLYTFGKVFFDTSFLENFKALDSIVIKLLGKSIVIASITALLTTFLGGILSFILYKTDIKYAEFYKIALLIPLVISPYILAVAWKDILLAGTNNTDIYNSVYGLIWVLILLYTPLSMLIIGNALTNIDAHIEESALLILPTKKLVFKIIIPLIKPALATSFVLVFIFSISEFSVPAFLGIKVFTTEIFTQFSAFYKHNFAIMQSMLLVVLCLILLYTEKKQLSEASFLSVSDRGTHSLTYKLNKLSQGLRIIPFVWFFVSVILPFALLFYQSFKTKSSFVQAVKLLLPALKNSFYLALTTALFIIIIGFIIASYSVKNRRKQSLITLLLLIVFAIPSSIYGISLIQFYNRPFLNFIYSGYAILIIAFVGKFTFIAVKIIEHALKQLPDSLDEVGEIMGISLFSRIKNIRIFLILPSLFATFIIGFIFSFSELGTSIMLYPPGTEIVPIKVYTLMANSPEALVSAMSFFVYSVSLLIISLFYLLFKAFIKYYDSIKKPFFFLRK